jgi:uroporphyrinogen-III synthase
MTPATLTGRRILVTRAAEDAEPWAARLRQLGALPVVLPCLVNARLDDADTARALRAAIAGASWLVLASRRAAEAVAAIVDGALPPALHVAVVGPATARAAALELGRVDLVATESNARGLARELLSRLGGAAGEASVVVAGAVYGRTDVERALEEAGVPVTRVNVYAMIPAPADGPKRDLAAEGIDAILLASPSAAEGFVNRAHFPPDAHVITIGPTTSAAAEAVGLPVSAEARRPDLDGMLEALP